MPPIPPVHSAIIPQQQPPPPPPARPFAEIDEVSKDSPAAAAGLRVGDRVLKFGNVDAAVICAQGMAALAGLVNRSENLELEVVVQHAGEACPSSITLIPRRWQGRGMLGCHLNPLAV